VHDRDLPGGPAEVDETQPQPVAKGVAEGDEVLGYGVRPR
jgi:hypothetical protein